MNYLSDSLLIAGAALIGIGLWIVVGFGWALVFVGAFLIVLATLVAMNAGGITDQLEDATDIDAA